MITAIIIGAVVCAIIVGSVAHEVEHDPDKYKIEAREIKDGIGFIVIMVIIIFILSIRTGWLGRL